MAWFTPADFAEVIAAVSVSVHVAQSFSDDASRSAVAAASCAARVVGVSNGASPVPLQYWLSVQPVSGGVSFLESQR
jgi:hypothetical protein